MFLTVITTAYPHIHITPTEATHRLSFSSSLGRETTGHSRSHAPGSFWSDIRDTGTATFVNQSDVGVAHLEGLSGRKLEGNSKQARLPI